MTKSTKNPSVSWEIDKTILNRSFCATILYDITIIAFLSKFESFVNTCKNVEDMIHVSAGETEAIQLKEAMIIDYMHSILKPKGKQTAVVNPKSFTIDLRGGRRDPLVHWHDYYKSLDELDIDLKDAVRLRADLIYGGEWYSNSGKLLDTLFRIKIQELEGNLQSPDTSDAKVELQRQELEKMNGYLKIPESQRWSEKTIGPQVPGLYTQAIDVITQLENNYLVPLRTPLADHPIPI